MSSGRSNCSNNINDEDEDEDEDEDNTSKSSLYNSAIQVFSGAQSSFKKMFHS